MLKPRNPVSPSNLLSKAQHCFETNRIDEAQNILGSFLNGQPRDAQANLLMAQVLVAKQMFKEAIPFAETAVETAPFHPGTNYFLGRLYLELDIFEKAAPLFYQSLKKAPQSALLEWALADMYMAMNQGENAAKHYARALALPLDEERKIEIKHQLGHCLSSINRDDEAMAIYDTLLDKSVHAGYYMVQKSVSAKAQELSDLEITLTDMIANPANDTNTQAKLMHAQGSVYHRTKRYDLAFEYWENAKNLTSEVFKIDAFEGTVDNLISFYSKAMIKEYSGFGHSSAMPLFIFGMPRSGTTLAEQIISAHKDAGGVGELGRMGKLEYDFFATYSENRDEQKLARDIHAGELVRNAEQYLDVLEKLVVPLPKHVVDKAVAQYQAAGFIHLCFPKAKFIHCVRHPADSYLSALQNRLDHAYTSNQNHYARYFLGKEKYVAYWKTSFPDKIFDLHYEKLVENPEPVVRQLLDFLELDWDPNCMKFFEQKSTVQTLSLRQVRQPIYTSSVYRWKNYEKHLGPLFETLANAGFTYPNYEHINSTAE